MPSGTALDRTRLVVCHSDAKYESQYPHIGLCNIHWMEIFVLGFYLDDPRQVWGFVNVDANHLGAVYKAEKNFQSKHPNAWFEFPYYKRSAGTAGIDTVTIRADGLSHIGDLLQDKAILDAARHLNWDVMNLGRTVYGRYHCYDLADLLL
jgi:hypothetical protein